jgi:hypothetical protein
MRGLNTVTDTHPMTNLIMRKTESWQNHTHRNEIEKVSCTCCTTNRIKGSFCSHVSHHTSICETQNSYGFAEHTFAFTGIHDTARPRVFSMAAFIRCITRIGCASASIARGISPHLATASAKLPALRAATSSTLVAKVHPIAKVHPKYPTCSQLMTILSHTRCPKSERLGGCTRGNDPAPRHSPAQILPYPRMKRTPPTPRPLCGRA